MMFPLDIGEYEHSQLESYLEISLKPVPFAMHMIIFNKCGHFARF